ncbi:MAG: FliO/MopB family protein [bacterium]
MALFLLVGGLSRSAWAIDSDSSLFSPSATSSTAQTLALPTATPSPAPGFFSILLRLVFALAITIGLIYLTVLGLKMIWDKQAWNVKVDDGKPIRVLSSLHLGPRKSLQVVEIGKKLLVLGVGHEEIHCLSEITEPEEIEIIKQAGMRTFPNLLQRVVRKQEGVAGEPAPEKFFEESRQVLGGYLDKLKAVSKRKKDKNQEDGDSSEK